MPNKDGKGPKGEGPRDGHGDGKGKGTAKPAGAKQGGKKGGCRKWRFGNGNGGMTSGYAAWRTKGRVQRTS